MGESLKKLCIVGAGGLARETLLIAKAVYDAKGIDYTAKVVFLVKDEEWTNHFIMGVPQIKESLFDHELYEVVIAVGNTQLRKKIADKLPSTTVYITLIHPKADLSDFVTIGKGSIIASGVIITCNITIGEHCVIDRSSNIGHDCIIGNYSHLAPAVVLSGNVVIQNSVYLGTQSCVKENIIISNNTIIGMGAVVVKSILENGTYVGNPAKKLN